MLFVFNCRNICFFCFNFSIRINCVLDVFNLIKILRYIIMVLVVNVLWFDLSMVVI